MLSDPITFLELASASLYGARLRLTGLHSHSDWLRVLPLHGEEGVEETGGKDMSH